jgi:hypothetical protein
MHIDEFLHTLFSELNRYERIFFECCNEEQTKYFINLEPQYNSLIRFRLYTEDFQVLYSCLILKSEQAEEETRKTLYTYGLRINSIAYIHENQEKYMFIHVFSDKNLLTNSLISTYLGEQEVDTMLKVQEAEKIETNQFIDDYDLFIQMRKRKKSKF